MARKIVDVTNSASLYDILSQTPKNYSDKNYFLKELQDKLNAEWEYRPNRVDIEYEVRCKKANTKDKKLQNIWEPLEVVIQTNKSEKGEAIADDNKNIVFKNILEDRFRIGSKFRFAPNYDLNAPEKIKDIWLGVNIDKASMTANMIIQRCNGILGSTYLDDQGIIQYHYEPVVQARDISSTSFSYSEVSVSPQAHLVLTAQYNNYTSNYYINQRFIIGARKEDPKRPGHFIDGQVYRITAIDKGYNLSTWNTEDVGLIKLYVELTEASVYDNWDDRIAYQNDPKVHLDTKTDVKGYSIIFKTPEIFPSDLYSNEISFTPVIVSDGEEYDEFSNLITTEIELENWPSKKSIEEQNNYIEFIENKESEEYSFTLRRKKIYMNGDLIVRCKINEEDSPSGSEIITTFKLIVRKQEL